MLKTINLSRTYLVIITRPFLHIYLSQNATPWHHSRKSLWGRKKRAKYDATMCTKCVCDQCKHNAKNEGLTAPERKP